MSAIHERVAACRAGADPTLVARLESGWVVMGDRQVIAGYCLLLPDPVVPDLNALPAEAQAGFLADMARVGGALLELTGAVRINYAIFGNLEPALHAHVFPRRASEPAELRTAHPWAWDWTRAPAFDGERDGPLLRSLRARLARGRLAP
jgi:diadenosine tetraphosphate (Ap4A) HIT family hydrolase